MFAKIFESEPPLYYLPDETGGIPSGTGLGALYNPDLVTPPRIYAESIYEGSGNVTAVFVKKERTPDSDFTVYVMTLGVYIHWPSYNYTEWKFDGTTGAYLSRSAPASLSSGGLYAYQIFQARDGSLWRQSILSNFYEIDTLTYLAIPGGTVELPAKYGVITIDLPMVDRAQNLVVMKTNADLNSVSVHNFTTGALVRQIKISGLPVQIFPEDATRCYVVSETFLISPPAQMLNLINYATGEVISTLRAPALEAGAKSYTYAWDRFLRRILVFTLRADTSFGACTSTLSGYYPVPLCVSMLAPIPLIAPRINRRTPFLTRIYGDAGEGIAGAKFSASVVSGSLVGTAPFADSDGEAIVTIIPSATGVDYVTVTTECGEVDATVGATAPPPETPPEPPPVTPPPTPPPPPVVTGTAPYMSLSWAAVSGATAYRIYFGSTRSGYYPYSVNVGNVTAYAMGGLTQGSSYYFAIAAIDSGGVESAISYETSSHMPVAAQIKYVSTTGSDAAAGSLAAPWRTIQKAMNTVVAGDTVLVRAGTYIEKLAWNTGHNGTAGNKITFRPYDGESVTISASGLSFGTYEPHISLAGAQYMRFQGFTIAGGSSYNAVYSAANFHHVEVVDNDISGCALAGIFFEAPNGSATVRMTSILGNTIHGNGNGGLTIYQGDGQGYYRIAYNVVHGNTSVGANFDGMQIGSAGGGTNHVVVKRNEVYDEGNYVGADLLDLGGHSINHHYLVEENYVHNPTGYGHFKCHGGDANVGSVWVVGQSGFHIVRYNFFKGLLWDLYDDPDAIVGYNNTWYDCDQIHQQGFFSGVSAPVNLGDSSYASWKTAKALTDTDTGRYCRKNELVYQNTSASLPLINFGNPLPDLTYKSQRWQNNMYKGAGSQYFLWYPASYAITTAGLASMQASLSPNFPETGSSVITTALASMFRNAGSADWRLMSTSPARGAAASLTRALNAGTSSTNLIVDRASFFCDGYPSGGELVTNPDMITIGGGAAVEITSINDATNVITLAAARTWALNDTVTLSGVTDIGAQQFVSDTQLATPAKPTITLVAPV